MADMQGYENKYRKYLEDDIDTYLKPEPSKEDKIISGGVAAVGLVGGGLLAYKRGGLKHLMHGAIKKAGAYRKGKIIGANNSIRRFSEDEGLGKAASGIGKLIRGDAQSATEDFIDFKDSLFRFKDYMKDGKIEHQRRMAELAKSKLIDKNFEAHMNHASSKDSIGRLEKEGLSAKELHKARSIMNDEIIKMGQVSDKEQALHMKRTGFRFATVQDLIDQKELSGKEEFITSGRAIYEQAGKKADDFMKSRVDKNILIDNDGSIADVRDFKSSFSGFINSLSTDFTIPLIKINPMRMFYLDQFFNTKQASSFFVAASNTRQPLITNHSGSMNKPALYSNGKVFQFDKGEAVQADGDFFLADANKGPVARLMRNMSGITISKFNKPKKDDPLLQRIKYHVGSVADIGFQDEPPGQFDWLDPTSWGQGIMNKGTGFLRQNKYVEREDYLSNSFGADAEFIFMRRYKNIEDSGSYKGYLKQFTAGRESLDKDVTMASLFPYAFFERLNATLNQVNLGLSNKSMGSAFDIFSGLMLKRVAPIWAGMEMVNYLNYESENFMGEEMSDKLAKMYANTSVELSGLRERLGITDWAKNAAPLFVGGEQITEIPFVGRAFNLDDTQEETEHYWEEGEDPVRRGRWWPLGNTPYTGMAIDYYQPNWVRRTLSNYKYSDSQYGSPEEYFENSWMPTLRHPLAPIKHFLTDPYHWEEKHYQDRPYEVTGGIPEIENFPLIGPLLNNTLGQLLKPSRRMHVEDMQEQTQYNTDSMMIDAQMQNQSPINHDITQDVAQEIVDTSVQQSLVAAQNSNLGQRAAAAAIATPAMQSDDQSILDTASVPIGGSTDVMAQAYVTSSGQVQVLQPETDNAVWEARAISDEFSPMRTGQFQRMRLDDLETEDMTEMMGGADSPIALSQAAADLHYNMSEMAGFYGFIGTSITGELEQGVPVLEASSEMSSYSRAFWDMDIGGFGGDANEIFRRFLPKDRKLNEVNGVENTMPDYLPGSDYFVDFQHGDPYTKIKKGEMRLPGEGYERLYDIDMDKEMKLDIGSSNIGYDEATIREGMLKRDAYMEESFKRKLDYGTKWHEQWEKDMDAQGIAISMEQYVKDEDAGIGGFYDVYAKHDKALDWLFANAKEFTYYNPSTIDVPGANTDPTFNNYFYEGDKLDLSSEEDKESFREFALAQSDKALIDPKTRGTKSWENDEMHFENVQQVNMYAQQMKTPINYLIHVDREDPDKGIKVFAFGSNPELYNYTKNKVEGVRQGIREDIENGELSRGDLYDPIDRYRTLADVAPYSAEFRQMKAQVQNTGYDEDEMNEVREINKQVQARKDKNRFYDYRFKTANLDEELVTVDQVIDANTFTTKENPNNPVRLAGIHVSTDKTKEESEKALRIIEQTIQPGAKVKIAYDADEANKVKDDTYKTIQSVVYDQRGINLNKQLLDKELATEKENDWSPAAVHARFTQKEIQFGSAWESFAHMDTMLHTKLLQVRSPLESYERREVYGRCNNTAKYYCKIG